MVVADRIYHEPDLPEVAQSFRRDTLTLGSEDRTRGHGRRMTDRGVEFGISLPRGTALVAGDLIVLDSDRLVVAVVEQDEPVFVIEPRSISEAAMYAYQIGNRHQPLMIADRSLVCPDVPGVEQLLRQHGIPYTPAIRPFTPIITGARHTH